MLSQTQIVLPLILISLVNSSSDEVQKDNAAVHARRKRFVAFPEGSSFSVSICWTIGVIGNPNVNFLSYGLNWGVSYELPNVTWAIRNVYGIRNHAKVESPASESSRSDRKMLYRELEIILNSMGYGGKDCILRALCETSKLLNGQARTMEEQIIRTIFSLPVLAKWSLNKHRIIEEYDEGYRTSDEAIDCSNLYPSCGFSLIALAFGKHSTPTVYMK